MTRPDLSALEALKELHKTIAEELHEDPETWPDHGNAPLAIAAAFMLVKLRAERAEAERDAAQRESEEQARLLGMSGSREAALLGERDTLRAVVRAADAIWKTMTQTPDRTDAMAAYFTASAKVPK